MSEDVKEHGKTKISLRLVASFAVAGILAAVFLFALDRAHEAEKLASCQNNLKQNYSSFKKYLNEHGGSFPRLSRVPGRFAPEFRGYYPSYLDDPGVFVCPSDLAAATEGAFANHDLRPIWNDHSYIYFGFSLRDEEEAFSFLETYEREVTDAIRADNLVYDELHKEWLLPEQLWDDVRVVGEDRATWDRLYLHRLNANLARYFTDIYFHPSTMDWFEEFNAAMPVMWDRPGTETTDFNHEPRGTNILFLDGHVELVSDPSSRFILSPCLVEKFVQTEARVEALYSSFLEAQEK